jgi:hypothetical protein
VSLIWNGGGVECGIRNAEVGKWNDLKGSWQAGGSKLKASGIKLGSGAASLFDAYSPPLEDSTLMEL